MKYKGKEKECEKDVKWDKGKHKESGKESDLLGNSKTVRIREKEKVGEIKGNKQSEKEGGERGRKRKSDKKGKRKRVRMMG